jgi:DNA-binding MarR family transcriptional regulator
MHDLRKICMHSICAHLREKILNCTPMIQNDVQEFRVFTRFYTAYVGVLNKRFMNSKYSLPQTRVLHAVYTQDGITPTEIASLLNMDKSYLSRILITFEKKKLITKKISVTDGRAFNLSVTKAGQKEFGQIDAAYNKQVENLLSQLTDEERKTLIKSMNNAKQILSRYKF